MGYRIKVSLLFLFLFVACAHLAMGAENQGPPLPNQPGFPPTLPPPTPDLSRQSNVPPLKMIASGVFEIGGAKILKKDGSVEFPATVNMDRGLLEYLIVGGGGKLHESLLRTEVEPYCIQIALLMIGLEGTTNPLVGQGDPKRPEGDPVSIWVKWEQGGRQKKARIEEWVCSEKNKKPLKPMQWVFTGSMVYEGIFLAQVEKSIVAVFHDPTAIIDNPLPEGASDEIWFALEGEVPPPGTELTVIVRKEEERSE